MTDPIYARDASVHRFVAMVTARSEGERSVVPNATAFYPGGGGQPHDLGTIRTDDGRAGPVTAVTKAGATILHTLGGEDPIAGPGDAVTGEIDWDRRYRLMRTHTALHILCGVVFRDDGARVTGGRQHGHRQGPDGSRSGRLRAGAGPGDRAAGQCRGGCGPAGPGDLVAAGGAFATPDLIRTKVNLLPEGITEVRIVELVGPDLQAGGGTHVANTREVGGIRVVGTLSKGKNNERPEIVLLDGPPGDGRR